MSNVPGAIGILPSVVVEVVTQSKGASVPGGIRVASIIGEGSRSEVITPSAQGNGIDGLNPTYTSTNGSDGRHFLLSTSPIVSNRTLLFRNGVPLIGKEATIDANPFIGPYDYRIDISTGRIELQRAHLIDQGGSFYSKGATNVGVGSLQNLTLTDINAPSETWTIKCVAVQRNNLNQPVAGTAKFVAFGSISGNILDANGNPTVWVANNQVATNTILSFSIFETLSGPTAISPFREGDYFTVKVNSGALNKGDSLTATYIGVGDLNDPTFFATFADITTKHGAVSLDNTLSLGCQLAFANNAPGIMCVQAAPPIPRRQSYELVTNFPATSTNVNDFVIPLPLGVSPDDNSNIHIFVTNPSTGVEKQLLANKFPFFTLLVPGSSILSQAEGTVSLSSFVFDTQNPPSGNGFSYSVIQQNATLNFGTDGYLNRDLTTQINSTFSSSNVVFDSTYVGKQVFIVDASNNANVGTFDIVSVVDGKLSLLASGTPPFADFINESSLLFNLINSVTGSIVPLSSGNDGVIVASANTATATFNSSLINFGTLNAFANGYKLQIISATNNTNLGLFDITGYSSGPNLLTIAKSFVSESNLRFEVIDMSQTSDYLVLNKMIVPNGYNLRVTLVDIKDASFFDAGWQTALASLETQECDIVVPLPKQTISAIFQEALSHCLTMSNAVNRKERVLYIGAIDGLTPDNLTGAKPAAVENIGVLEGIQGSTVSDILSGNTEDLADYSVKNAYGETFRVVYFFPDEIVVQVGSDNQIISGFYIAAAAAGYTSSVNNIASPLTNKILAGFTILRNRQFNQTTLQKLAAAGVSILAPVVGGGRILWGKTTTQSGAPEEEEISIVFIRDRIAKTMRTGFGGYIGQPEDKDTVATLTARALALLNSFISQNLITDFADLTVSQDLVEPRQFDISMMVQPTYSLNWIYIKVGIGTL